MRHFLLSLVVLVPLTALPQSRTLSWTWPNIPCQTVIDCDQGCSACNLAAEQFPEFVGNQAMFYGVEACPWPVTPGNNMVHTTGWPLFPDPQKHFTISGVAMVPMRIDSVLISHRSGDQGPQRLRVLFGINQTAPVVEVADLPTTVDLETTILKDLGTVAADEGMTFGFFKLVLQPYQGEGGSWDVDAVRVVATPALTTGITVLVDEQGRPFGVPHDVLGRTVGPGAGTGIHLHGEGRGVMHDGRRNGY